MNETKLPVRCYWVTSKTEPDVCEEFGHSQLPEALEYLAEMRKEYPDKIELLAEIEA